MKNLENASVELLNQRKDELESLLIASGGFLCSCPKCGFKRVILINKHCKDYKCPKCAVQMRRVNRPGKGETAEKDLEIAPYRNIRQLPKAVKNKMSPSLLRTFLKVWNDAYERYGSEAKSFRISWSVIKKISKLDKTGKLVRKAKSRLTVAIIKEELEKEID